MDVLSVLKGDNQRYFLAHLLPGTVALWPFAILLKSGLNIPINYNSEFQVLILLAFYLFFSFGLGVLLEDIGSLIELRLEDIYFDLKSRERDKLKKWNKGLNIFSLLISIPRHTLAFILIFVSKIKISKIDFNFNVREWLLGCHLDNKKFNSREEARDEFYKTWHCYLELSFKEGKEPAALRYYRAVLLRFKFEINMSVAFLLMLFGHMVFEVRELGLRKFLTVFTVGDTWLYLGGIAVTVSILIVEAFKMIELLDKIRSQLVSISKK